MALLLRRSLVAVDGLAAGACGRAGRSRRPAPGQHRRVPAEGPAQGRRFRRARIRARFQHLGGASRWPRPGINPRDQRRPGGVDVYTYLTRNTRGLTQSTDFASMILVGHGRGHVAATVRAREPAGAPAQSCSGPDGGFSQPPRLPGLHRSTGRPTRSSPWPARARRVRGVAAAQLRRSQDRALDWLQAHQGAGRLVGGHRPHGLRDRGAERGRPPRHAGTGPRDRLPAHAPERRRWIRRRARGCGIQRGVHLLGAPGPGRGASVPGRSRPRGRPRRRSITLPRCSSPTEACAIRPRRTPTGCG